MFYTHTYRSYPIKCHRLIWIVTCLTSLCQHEQFYLKWMTLKYHFEMYYICALNFCVNCDLLYVYVYIYSIFNIHKSIYYMYEYTYGQPSATKFDHGRSSVIKVLLHLVLHKDSRCWRSTMGDMLVLTGLLPWSTAHQSQSSAYEVYWDTEKQKVLKDYAGTGAVWTYKWRVNWHYTTV